MLEVLDSNAPFSPDSYSPQHPSTRERLHDTAFGERLTGKCLKQMHQGYTHTRKKKRLEYLKTGNKTLPVVLEALLNSFLLVANCSPE